MRPYSFAERILGYSLQTTRDVRVEQVVMERRETRINAFDFAKNESRSFRLDRIEKAEVIAAV